MKWVKTLVKNFKVLMRSKGSALMVLLAPLLIVLIIGLSFAGKVENTLDVGLYLNGNNNELTNRFVTNLNTSDKSLTIFPTEQSCINAIKESVVVTCIVFPKNFVISDNNTNEVTFYVDESRMNLVYQLISSITLNVGGESGEISKEITQRLLMIVDETKKNVDATISSTVSVKAKLKGAEGLSGDIKNKVSGMDVSANPVDMNDELEGVQNISDALIDLDASANTVLIRGYEIVTALGSSNISSTSLKTSLDALKVSLNNSNDVIGNTADILDSLNAVSAEMEDLNKKLETAATVKTAVSTNVDKLDTSIKSLTADIDLIKIKQEAIASSINSFGYRSAESISNPITTKVESVSSKNNKVTYSFPYLLMLVVLFVGIMLSSTIVFMEKDSRAYFRNFTTPTKNAHFILMNYFTSLLIIVVQVAVILLAVYFGLNVPILNHIEVTIVFLFLGMTVFILIGMIIGNLFSTSEAITMSTIAIGSVLLFLSNLVLPLETLSPIIAKIASYNPYVIVSEAIRRAMLMDAGLSDMYFQIIILAVYSFVLLILVILMKKLSSTKLFERLLTRKPKQVFTVPEDHYLKLDNDKIIIRSIPELLNTLKHMSNADYNAHVKPKNVFSKWLKESLNEKRLALKIEYKSLENAIKVLEKYMDRK